MWAWGREGGEGRKGGKDGGAIWKLILYLFNFENIWFFLVLISVFEHS